MGIYIRRVDEFDARQYMPNDPEFDVQAYIDWIVSFSGTSVQYYPTTAVQNPDGTLTVSWEDGVGGFGNTWDSIVQETDYGLIQTFPVLREVEFLSEADFEYRYQPRP